MKYRPRVASLQPGWYYFFERRPGAARKLIMGNNLANLSRPSTFGSAIGEAARLNGEIIRNQVRTGKISHTYLMTGLKGSGKTTTARTLARALNCLDLKDGEPCGCCRNCLAIQRGESMDVKEIDAARNNGVDFAKSIEEDASYQPMEMKKKVYILDECHCLTNDAFSSLLKLIEEPPEWTVFIFCTTDPQKMPATIRSRCQEYRFKAVSLKEMSAHLIRTASEFGARLDEGGAEMISRHSGGSVRDALMSLEICLGEEVDITAARVGEILGIEGWQSVFGLLGDLVRNDRVGIISAVDRYFAEGRRVADVIGDCLQALTDKLRSLAGAQVEGNEQYLGYVKSLDVGEEQAFELADSLREALEKVRYSPDRGTLTVSLLRAASVRGSSLAVRLAEAERRIDALEKGILSGTVRVTSVPGGDAAGCGSLPEAGHGPAAEAVDLPDIFSLGDFFFPEPSGCADAAAGAAAAEVPPAAREDVGMAGAVKEEDGPDGGDAVMPEASGGCGFVPAAEYGGTPFDGQPGTEGISGCGLLEDEDGEEPPFADGGACREPVTAPAGGVSPAASPCPEFTAREAAHAGAAEGPAAAAPAERDGSPENAPETDAWAAGLSLDALFDAVNNGASPEMRFEWECNTNSFLKELAELCEKRVEDGKIIIYAPNEDVRIGLECCAEVAGGMDYMEIR